MSNHFTVSMFNVSTGSLDAFPAQDSGHKTNTFDNKTQALEYAATNKNKYKVVIVKNPKGDIILKYHDGREG